MNKLTFRVHALQKMTERNISVDDVAFVIENGEIIREYLDDTPYPSCLMLAWRDDRPLHVVTAENLTDSETIIITAYEPDPAIWEADFKKKRV